MVNRVSGATEHLPQLSGQVEWLFSCIRIMTSNSAPASALQCQRLISTLDVRINRYVPVRRPDFSDLCRAIPAAERRRPIAMENVRRILDICVTTPADSWKSRLNYCVADKMLIALTPLTTDLDSRIDIEFSPEERGILLFEAAAASLQKSGGAYHCIKAPYRFRYPVNG